MARAAATFRHYKNPFRILWKRFTANPIDMMAIVDRNTGIRCNCPVAAFHMFAGIWYQGDYDIPHLPIRPNDSVIDVGANHGFFALYAAQKGAKVYAFEPSPAVFERLQSNIRSNGFEAQIAARPWAIAGESGRAQLMVTEQLGGGMSTMHAGFAEKTRIPVRERVTVECHTLSEILQMWGIARVRLLKIDAEGLELEILKGLNRNDRARFESIVLECHPEAYEVAELLSELMAWGTHQVSFVEPAGFAPGIVRLVSNENIFPSA